MVTLLLKKNLMGIVGVVGKGKGKGLAYLVAGAAC